MRRHAVRAAHRDDGRRPRGGAIGRIATISLATVGAVAAPSLRGARAATDPARVDAISGNICANRMAALVCGMDYNTQIACEADVRCFWGSTSIGDGCFVPSEDLWAGYDLAITSTDPTTLAWNAQVEACDAYETESACDADEWCLWDLDLRTGSSTGSGCFLGPMFHTIEIQDWCENGLPDEFAPPPGPPPSGSPPSGGNDDDDDKALNNGEIAGVVVGCVAFAGLIFACVRRARRTDERGPGGAASAV
jgi:hypothetical protein